MPGLGSGVAGVRQASPGAGPWTSPRVVRRAVPAAEKGGNASLGSVNDDEDQGEVFPNDQRLAICFHEASHCVMAYQCGIPIVEAALDPDGGHMKFEGYTGDVDPPSLASGLSWLFTILAGQAGVAEASWGLVSGPAEDDEARARDLAYRLTGSPLEAEALLGWARLHVANICAGPRFQKLAGRFAVFLEELRAALGELAEEILARADRLAQLEEDEYRRRLEAELPKEV
jgi:hypothetical protein